MSQADVERIFIGWDGPVLARAAVAFLERFGGVGPLDMNDVVVVVPGGRAGRVFLSEISARGCGARPKIVTPGRLVDVLLGIEGAGDPLSVLRLVWREAVERCCEDVVSRLGVVHDKSDRLRVLDSIARRVQAWHQELGGEGMRVRDTAERMQELGDGLVDRVAAGGEVERVYEMLVAERGLRDRVLAHLDALDNAKKAYEHPVVLVCTPDMGGLTRLTLDRVCHERIAIIAAPESNADGFDRYGCAAPAYWRGVEIPLDDDQIRFEDSEQACSGYALAAIARDAGASPADRVRLGVTDPGLSVLLEREAAKHPGVGVRSWRGRALSRSRLGVFLGCLRRYCGTRSFEDYAALVRHPDVEHMIDATLGVDDGGWIDDIDVFQAEHLPKGVPERWARRGDNDILARVAEIVDGLTSDFLGASGDSGRMGRELVSIVRSLYGDTTAELHSEIEQACQAFTDANDRIGGALSRGAVGADCDTYLGLVLEEFGRTDATVPRDAHAVEVLGWLELAWDDADVCAVVGMNDGYVPGSKSQDSVLSDGVRESLGLAHDASRFGRDCYLLQVLVRSTERLTVTCARRDCTGSPVVPSRLLLRCDNASLVNRMQRVSGSAPEPTPDVRLATGGADAAVSIAVFPIAPTVEHDAVARMRVTSFKTYLRSPYLFFLQHVLRLSEKDGEARELGAMEYGNLIHNVLESFGRSEIRDAHDEHAIEEYVLDELSRFRRVHYGNDPLPAVALQLRLLEYRLKDFAAWQAARVRRGWRIQHIEWQASGDSAGIEVDGEVMRLRGKIDRIDRREGSGEVCVIDYKTGREIKSPDKTHRNKQGWTDLQLPLYRHLARDVLGGVEDVGLAYVVLPRRSEGVRLLEAGWSAVELQEADEAARCVVRAVRDNRFEDLGDLDRVNDVSRVMGALSGISVVHEAGGEA